MSRNRHTVFFVPHNRLSKIVSSLDRRSFAEHVARAEEEVEAVAAVLAESLNGDVQILIRMCRQDEADIFAQSREIGWLALRILETARLGRREELARAAEGVWEMIEALSERGVWHTDALRLHVEALNALTSSIDIDDDEQIVMDQALVRMRQAIGAKVE